MLRSVAFCLALLTFTTAASAAEGPETTVTPLRAAVARAAAAEASAVPAAWMVDHREVRPVALPALYGTYAAMQVFDMYSTKKAMAAGARETNPAMGAGNLATMIAVKAAAGAGTIYFTERAWKKNKVGAVATMVALNGATAMIAAHNMRNAHR